jgi:hypothetical protein
VDKQERRRAQRKRLRKARARDAAQKRGAVARRLRVWEHTDAVERALIARAYDEAVEHAAAAVALLPHDVSVARLYVGRGGKVRQLSTLPRIP